MPLICYQNKNFRSDKLALIDKINSVIEEYQRQGYSLTLRQCYYQLVARGIIENNERSYKNTGNLINDARLAGLIDWNAIEDRTRNLKRLSHWSNPQSIIESASDQYMNVPYFCCRGYVSQSEMWSASQRFIAQQEKGKMVALIHLGDHDPSGIDMSRDIEERLLMFGVDSDNFIFKRIALNMEQIDLYNPPPNPAKITDSRCGAYIREYGDKSWELDALEPKVIHDLITDNVTVFYDEYKGDQIKAQVQRERAVMNRVAENWDYVYDMYNDEE